MAKKEIQWLIDRAFNFISTNEPKVKSVLTNLEEVKEGTISYSDALVKMKTEGGISDVDRYERSTQTAYKSLALIQNKETISPISESYVKGKIDYKSLIISQCFKKQYNKTGEYKVRPLIVTLSVLKKIYDNEETRTNAWIDPYDYLNHLTEVHDYADIDACVANILADKSLSKEDRKVEEVKDCDIWYNLFESTGLFVKHNLSESYNIMLNENEMDMINFLLSNHKSAPLILDDPAGNMSKDDYWLNQGGANETGIVSLIPHFDRGSTYEIKGISSEAIGEMLYLTLVAGFSNRITDDIVLGYKDTPQEGSTKGFLTNNVLKAYGIPVDKAKGIFKPFRSYLSLLRLSEYYDSYNDIIEIMLGNETESKKLIKTPVPRKTGGDNLIYYGTPGCGKSYLVDELYENKEGYKTFRTVFHPEYSNTDFVGQIIPKVDEADSSRITYDFEAGVFTKALIYAYNNADINVILIIEEINRGNAAAIFGEIFQLLDRNANGESNYGIKSYKIAEQLEIGMDTDVKIPSNMTIVATMNTSDQNVYSLDTAFKRRWKMKKIRNTFADIDDPTRLTDKSLDYKRELSAMYIPGSNIKWREFVEKVNNKINERGKTFSIMSEDKEIGIYFVSKTYLSESPNNQDKNLISLFAEKVLMYIWNDIAKTNVNKWFDGCNTLDEVLDSFDLNKDTDSLKVFKDSTGKYLFFETLNEETAE